MIFSFLQTLQYINFTKKAVQSNYKIAQGSAGKRF